MKSITAARSAPVLRRVLYGVFATCVVGGAAAVMVVPAADAANDPCAASEITRTIGSVAVNTGNYLDAHPDTNAALTAASQQQGPQALAMMKTYFDAHPQAGKDMQTLQQPLTGLTGRCRLPITLPQVLQMMQGAQAQNLPVLAPSPQSATVPAATGPLPGPGASVPAAPAAPAPAATTTR